MRKKAENSKVLLAMSGGVDSSFAGYLLREKGAEVSGVFLHLHPNSRCCSSEAELRARETAKRLGIPFQILDAREVFGKKVLDNFLERIKMGLTPNPCTVCNERVKFGFLLNYALENGFDFLATGHYSRVVFDPQKEVFRLFKGRDPRKDQSYMLYRLNQKSLPHALFPLGEWSKEEVFQKTRELGWEFQDVKESQDLCFLPPKTTLIQFLEGLGFPQNPGPIIDSSGKIIGTHPGLHLYTVGQRKGIKLPGGPFYVLKMDLERNALIVGKREEAGRKALIAGEINWVWEPPEAFPLQAKARIRYGHREAPAKIELCNNERLKVVFKEPQFAITPGQSVVFYQGEEVLGGGVILGPLE